VPATASHDNRHAITACHQPARAPALLAGRRRILVTGGAGFIGGAVVRRLLTDSDALVFNLDKCGYASDLTSIEQVLAELGERATTPEGESRHQLLRVDLTDAEATAAAVRQADPDLVMHLAAESHVDRSIEGPAAFIDSNVSGTFHLLQAVRAHWEQLPASARRASASTTSAPMRCSARWGKRAASRRPPPTTRAAPIRPARRPAITW
jgi:nucleoside-diphosphate-sugar epimerase